MLQPLDNKLVIVDKAHAVDLASNQSTRSYALIYTLLLEHSNLIGQLGAARILQCNGTNTGIRVILNYP